MFKKTSPISLFESQINLFRIWFVIVYHPREFFSCLFNKNCDHIKFDTTILLGLKAYNIDTKQQQLLSPKEFAYETSKIWLVTLTIVFYLYKELLFERIAEQNLPSLPVVFELPFANELFLAFCITAVIFLIAVFLAFYLFIFCEKGTPQRALIGFSVCTVTAWGISFIVGFSVCFLLILGASPFLENGEIGGGIGLLLFFLFAIYTFVLVYITIALIPR